MLYIMIVIVDDELSEVECYVVMCMVFVIVEGVCVLGEDVFLVFDDFIGLVNFIKDMVRMVL